MNKPLKPVVLVEPHKAAKFLFWQYIEELELWGYSRQEILELLIEQTKLFEQQEPDDLFLRV